MIEGITGNIFGIDQVPRCAPEIAIRLTSLFESSPCDDVVIGAESFETNSAKPHSMMGGATSGSTGYYTSVWR